MAADIDEAPGPVEKRALWWAKFATQYGLINFLAVYLLLVIMGYLPTPLLTGSKPVEDATLVVAQELKKAMSATKIELIKLENQVTALLQGQRILCRSLVAAHPAIAIQHEACAMIGNYKLQQED